MEDKNKDKIKSIIIAIINAIAIFFIFTYGIYCYTTQIADNKTINKYIKTSIEINQNEFYKINEKLYKLIENKKIDEFLLKNKLTQSTENDKIYPIRSTCSYGDSKIIHYDAEYNNNKDKILTRIIINYPNGNTRNIIEFDKDNQIIRVINHNLDGQIEYNSNINTKE